MIAAGQPECPHKKKNLASSKIRNYNQNLKIL